MTHRRFLSILPGRGLSVAMFGASKLPPRLAIFTLPDVLTPQFWKK